MHKLCQGILSLTQTHRRISPISGLMLAIRNLTRVSPLAPVCKIPHSIYLQVSPKEWQSGSRSRLNVNQKRVPMPILRAMSTSGHHRLRGSCHCGNIRIALDWPESEPTPAIPVRACGCSFCKKHKAAWTSNPNGRFSLEVNDTSKVTPYRLGTGTAEYHVCSNCGVVPIVTCVMEGARYAVLNSATFDDLESLQLAERATDFEGETKEERLARRRRTWTPEATEKNDGN